jgi:DNA-binding IclR family transcriptional regulator
MPPTADHVAVLQAVAALPDGADAVQVAAHVGLPVATVARVLDELAADGLVTSTRAPTQ